MMSFLLLIQVEMHIEGRGLPVAVNKVPAASVPAVYLVYKANDGMPGSALARLFLVSCPSPVNIIVPVYTTAACRVV